MTEPQQIENMTVNSMDPEEFYRGYRIIIIQISELTANSKSYEDLFSGCLIEKGKYFVVLIVLP